MTRQIWGQPPLPEWAISITAASVHLARVSWASSTPTVLLEASEALPSGAVVPSLLTPNMSDVGAVGLVVRRLASQTGGGRRRVALVLPDAVAKVSLVRLEQVPARETELVEIIRWQLRKSMPFPVEQAVISIADQGATPTAGEFLVAAARADVVQQYEQACRMGDLDVGLVDLESLCLLHRASHESGLPEGDWFFVRVDQREVTLMLGRGRSVAFHRHRADESEGSVADLIHQTAMFYEDRFQGHGFSRVWLAAAPDVTAAGEAQRDLQARYGSVVQLSPARPTAMLAGAVAPELGTL
jgi:type IV pilus assembly protein PilM